MSCSSTAKYRVITYTENVESHRDVRVVTSSGDNLKIFIIMLHRRSLTQSGPGSQQSPSRRSISSKVQVYISNYLFLTSPPSDFQVSMQSAVENKSGGLTSVPAKSWQQNQNSSTKSSPGQSCWTFELIWAL